MVDLEDCVKVITWPQHLGDSLPGRRTESRSTVRVLQKPSRGTTERHRIPRRHQPAIDAISDLLRDAPDVAGDNRPTRRLGLKDCIGKVLVPP